MELTSLMSGPFRLPNYLEEGNCFMLLLHVRSRLVLMVATVGV